MRNHRLFLGLLLLISCQSTEEMPNSMGSGKVLSGKPSAQSSSPSKVAPALVEKKLSQNMQKPISSEKVEIQSEVSERALTCVRQPVSPESIHFPEDIAVSSDGSKIYFLSNFCDTLPESPALDPVSRQVSNICREPLDFSVRSAKYLYEMKKDDGAYKPVTITSELEKDSFCFTSEIETEPSGERVFFNDFLNYRIRTFDGSQFATLVEGYGVSGFEYTDLYYPGQPTDIYWEPPQHLRWRENKLTYRKIAETGMVTQYQTRQIDLDTSDEAITYCSRGGVGMPSHNNHVVFSDDMVITLFSSYSSADSSGITVTSVKTNDTDCINDRGAFSSFTVSKPIQNEAYISDVVKNSRGELILSETFTHMLYKVTPPSPIRGDVVKMVPWVGSEKGFADGSASLALFNSPGALAIDAQDNVYVADTGNHAIRKVTPEGDVTTLFREENP